ncbi:biopolymer transporter ExbD [uncultured Sphaerochaeta sp.]|uniref:ExbD/TolR family protein n=1 Tax=uncultured Sphaerochaeta sp. TaxID=886478 RepID=UPI002A0A5D18|nr:biopolymer transporter ExbD [uncultured Sphaerochaeta sp.]
MRKKRISPSTAMTDIAFLLLLFFLILAISTMLTPIPLEPAQSETTTQAVSNKPVLIIGSDGTLFYENEPIDPAVLPKEEEITLLADKDTPFRLISPVLNALKKNGTTTVHCLVEQSQ